MALFLQEHKKFLILLLKYKVKFILIGGYAVIYHGYERTTNDMDLWLKPTNKNRDRFLEALENHGILPSGIKTVKKMDFTSAQVLHVGKPPNKIDFLTKLQGLNFDEALQKSVSVSLEEKQVPVLHYDHLIISKMLAGRPQDKADVDMLQKIKRAKDE